MGSGPSPTSHCPVGDLAASNIFFLPSMPDMASTFLRQSPTSTGRSCGRDGAGDEGLAALPRPSPCPEHSAGGHSCPLTKSLSFCRVSLHEELAGRWQTVARSPQGDLDPCGYSPPQSLAKLHSCTRRLSNPRKNSLGGRNHVGLWAYTSTVGQMSVKTLPALPSQPT